MMRVGIEDEQPPWQPLPGWDHNSIPIATETKTEKLSFTIAPRIRPGILVRCRILSANMPQPDSNSDHDSWEEGTNLNQETMAMSSAGDGESCGDIEVDGAAEKAADARIRAQASTDFDTLPVDFGRYHVTEKLGEGGMGSVYLAHDSQLNRKVALKMPKFARSNVSKLVERFYREARSAATLSHPNICPVFDAGEIDGTHYMAMGYVQGRSLSDFTRTEKRQTIRSAVRTVRKVAIALQDAHAHGVVHRDLKPGNIMIDHRNEPIVMDFGLACQADQESDSRLTQDGAILGSPAYMSPEQLEGKVDKIGPACDIYSLGVVLFELLTGELPFKGTGSIMSIIGEVFSKETPDPADSRENLDPRLSLICQKALAKEAENRYESMLVFAEELTLFLKTSGDELGSKIDPVVSGSAELIRAREQYELAQSLFRDGQVAAALAILEKMALLTDTNARQYVDWAKSGLGKHSAPAQQTTGKSDLPDLASDIWKDEFATPHDPLGVKSGFSSKTPINWLPYLIAASIGALIFMVSVIVLSTIFNDPKPAHPDDSRNENRADSTANESMANNEEPTNKEPTDRVDGGPGQPPRFRPPRNGQFGPGPGLGGRRPQNHPMSRLIEADKNGDKKISREEMPPRIRDAFERVDANKDGYLDLDEIRNAAQHPARPRP